MGGVDFIRMMRGRHKKIKYILFILRETTKRPIIIYLSVAIYTLPEFRFLDRLYLYIQANHFT